MALFKDLREPILPYVRLIVQPGFLLMELMVAILIFCAGIIIVGHGLNGLLIQQYSNKKYAQALTAIATANNNSSSEFIIGSNLEENLCEVLILASPIVLSMPPLKFDQKTVSHDSFHEQKLITYGIAARKSSI